MDDVVDPTEVKTEDCECIASDTLRPRGPRAWHVDQTRINVNPGDPARSFMEREYAGQVIIK